ncbi:MAG: flagellar hook-basal body complex protein [Cellvibrionaceae bacterium]|nr:flagellar hook-basal body complex protein [Cellvibrionaceae bacterium]
MPFQSALSGIRAASSDLSVTGNNIANASTTGFKASRVEFGDVYATSVSGAGSTAIGSGVQIQAVAQRFTQGNVSFTENELDLAINGNGFFVMDKDGESLYTRAGTFGLDADGFVVNNTGARLQGFSADEAGNLSGVRSDVQIETNNLAPRQTTLVASVLNLDSTEPVLQSIGRSLVTEGNAVGLTQSGLTESVTTTLSGSQFNLPLANNFSTTSLSFDVSLSAATDNNGTVSINLNSAAGVPATISTFNDLRTLASVINAQIFSPVVPQQPIDVIANAVDNGGGNYSLDFSAITEGEASQIALSNQSANAGDIGLNTGTTLVQGVPEVSNGYPQQSVDIIDPDGDVATYTSARNATAADTASELNALQGVSANAQTDLVLSNFVNSNGNASIVLNGITLTSESLPLLQDEINDLTNTTLPGITATIDPITGATLAIRSTAGDDLQVRFDSIDDGDSLTVTGDPDAPAQILEVDANGDGVVAGNLDAAANSIIVGGAINIVLDEGYSMENAEPPSVGLFQALNNASTFSEVVLNEFDPNDQTTYNSATSTSVFDSLGNPHVMTQYFVKQEFDPTDPTTASNHWMMYVLIDGQDVGDPDTSLPPPQNIQPTRAAYNVFFNEDGSRNNLLTDEMLVSNWTPLDASGSANGALGPQNVLAGGTPVIPDPPTSSNFVINLDGSTQFGADFAVTDTDQDGYATGRLSGLSIDDNGIIFARFTNGESQVLGQVVLASFANQQGLQPRGNTMWVENFESGPPNVGTPGSAALGAIQSGALEESNVDLSEQLVKLIIAQRNFQASAKTIETADQVTQTIINLR